MGIIEIGLTIWAWHRGWKTWALLPVGIGLCLSILLALVLHDAGVFKIYTTSIGSFIFIDVAVIATLIFMVAKAGKESNIDSGASGPDSFLFPRGKSNGEAVKSGISIKNITVSLPLGRAKLVLPNGSDIILNGTIRPIGRDDFKGRISSTALRYVSRQHFWIRSDKGKHFIEDYQSANGTKLNGVDIKGKGLHLLNDGDKIDVAGMVVLIYKVFL
jgi:hypothetical protein